MNQVRKKVAGQGLMPLHQYEVTCLACTPPLIATENRSQTRPDASCASRGRVDRLTLRPAGPRRSTY